MGWRGVQSIQNAKKSLFFIIKYIENTVLEVRTLNEQNFFFFHHLVHCNYLF